MTVVVTGAASGIGRRLVLSLLAAGRTVVGLDREVMEAASGFHPIQVDLTDPDAVAKAVENSLATGSPPTALVNSAGIYPVTPMLDLSVEEWNDVIDLNLRAPFLLTQALARHWIETKTQGCVVNVASTSAVIARPGTLHYAASKAGLVQMTKGMALELAPLGIRVNAVAPGLIATERVIAYAKGDGAAEHAAKLDRIPAAREGSPDEVCEAIFWLLSPASSYCVGSVLTLDGGYTLGIPSY